MGGADVHAATEIDKAIAATAAHKGFLFFFIFLLRIDRIKVFKFIDVFMAAEFTFE